MSRLQLALNVDDLDAAVRFYSSLFAVEPAKLKPGYANFVVSDPPVKLVLMENPGKGGSINHLGVEVESSDSVYAEIIRLSQAGLLTEEEIGTTCCFATQDKVWATGPDQEKWEIYTVLADSESFGVGRNQFATDQSATATSCCGGGAAAEQASATPPACC
ncbi:glyoxalase/bleomycin resistance/dioxygenase family protein [Gordonia desulfuricans]|uniref:Glyoxalase/bleomycin resistance/dioxygenase family protein n=1 Tax=Gordonia desulfuricans TaxID=89051 RepID=A0A7K3LKA0_9ACTN|nr:ArsI/CadI family heavy metal resistance metalloenzyme [Gordonia desulfuricans]NDK88654.1 glyoxalase/bleomycin resistance/dioxygenase family protein [Gordonia desulfuricans]